MMAGGDWRQTIREAQADVAEAQAQLRRPTAEAVESTRPGLERATGALERLVKCLKAGDPQGAGAGGNRQELRSGMETLRREVARTRVLLEGAAALRLGWAGRLYAAACGYTAQGEPAMPEVARRVSVEG